MTGAARQAQPPHARILGLEEAIRLGYEPVGCCDWGGCFGETVAMRWDYRRGEYLDVCSNCKVTTHLDRTRQGRRR